MAALRDSLRCVCLAWALVAFASADTITIYGSGSDIRTILSPPGPGVAGFAPVYHEDAVALFDVPPGDYTAAAFVLPVAGITPHTGLPQAPYNTEMGLSIVSLPGPLPLLASSATGAGGFGGLSIHFDDFPQFAGTMLNAANEFDAGGWFAVTGHIYGGDPDYWWLAPPGTPELRLESDGLPLPAAVWGGLLLLLLLLIGNRIGRYLRSRDISTSLSVNDPVDGGAPETSRAEARPCESRWN